MCGNVHPLSSSFKGVHESAILHIRGFGACLKPLRSALTALILEQEVALHLSNSPELCNERQLLEMHLLSYRQLSPDAQRMFLDIACMLLGKQMALVKCIVQVQL